jgi:hypothetical protein
MTVRRLALAAALVGLLLPALWQPAGGQKNIPSSIALLYPMKKIFKPGDWVLYKVGGQNERGETSTDCQRIQIGVVTTYRSEDCFWLETGWGPDPDRLNWGAVLVSENIFLDSLSEVRGIAYMRQMHVTNAPDGTPLALMQKSLVSKLPPGDLEAQRSTYTELGIDTLDTPRGRIACRLVEVKRTYRSARDMPDSTMQQGTISTARRWYNTDLIPITGLVREEEEKIYFQRAWPLGKPSTDYPMRDVGKDVLRVEMLDFGHGAKPMISDRVRVTTQMGGGGSSE